MLEVAVVLLILGILAAFTLPSAINSVKNYRLHSDASAIASSLNVVRMRAAREYTPHALDVDPSVTPPTYVIEELLSLQYDPLQTPPVSGTYASRLPPVYEQGTQYALQGTSYSICRPAGITSFPGTVTDDPDSCTGSAKFCFNTRGLPVLCTTTGGNPPGSPLINGGAALYVMNQSGLVDAVTIAVGGVVQVWNWDPNAVQWKLR